MCSRPYRRLYYLSFLISAQVFHVTREIMHNLSKQNNTALGNNKLFPLTLDQCDEFKRFGCYYIQNTKDMLFNNY